MDQAKQLYFNFQIFLEPGTGEIFWEGKKYKKHF